MFGEDQLIGDAAAPLMTLIQIGSMSSSLLEVIIQRLD